LYPDEYVEKRNKLLTFFKLYSILKKIQFYKIVYGGYAIPEFIMLCFLYPKSKNILQTESAKESLNAPRWKNILKEVILSRYQKAIVSGKIHKEVLQYLGFKGQIIISKGVGIIYKKNKQTIQKSSGIFNYLYVGRLIEVKNIRFLVNVFNKLEKKLTIVGKGVLENELKELSSDNITFLGFCDNKKLGEIYSKHQVFILPSVSEPWGLVVEEALYNDCVLLLSQMVGSHTELLTQPETGCVFHPENEKSLMDAIHNIEQNYQTYYKNVQNFNISEKDVHQINSYLELVK
jgi:Glycosyltransferase